MKKRESGNICGYWDCHQHTQQSDFLCAEHHQKWDAGLLDRCPKCGRFKDIMYYLCLDCYGGRPVTPWEPSVEVPSPTQHYRVEYSDAWTDGYMEPDRHLVYIIRFDDGTVYVGHTRDLGKRLSEHKDKNMSLTAGGNPRLDYVESAATQKAAELREGELKKLLDSNPEQVRLMVKSFHENMRELGFE